MASNQDFYSLTPGSAVADSLQDILTRRKAEARQSMLDQLNQKNVESEISYRNKQAESEAAARNDQIWQRRATLHGGDPVTGMSPNDIQQGVSGGWMTQDQPEAAAPVSAIDRQAEIAAGGSPSQTAPATPNYHWAATAESRKRQADTDTENQEQFQIDQMMADPNMSDADRKALTMARGIPEARHTLLSTLLNREMTPAPKLEPRYKMNRLTGKLEPLTAADGKPLMGSPNSPITEWGEQPQQPNAADQPTEWNIPDPHQIDPATGKPKMVTALATRKAMMATKPGHIFDDPNVRVFGDQVHQGNMPVGPAQKPYDMAAYRAYQTATRSPNADDNTKQAAALAFAGTISDPVVRQDVVSVITNPTKRSIPMDALLNAMTGVTPEQREMFQTVLYDIRGF